MKRLFLMKKAFLTFAILALLAPALVTAVASAAPAVHVVTHVSLTPRTPNVMKLGQNVTLGFSYVSPEPTGVRIFARPMTRGALTRTTPLTVRRSIRPGPGPGRDTSRSPRAT